MPNSRSNNKQFHPPKRVLQWLRWFCDPVYLEEIEGDLYELYQEEVELYGPRRAKRKYVMHAIRYFKPYFYGKKKFWNRVLNNLQMLSHNIRFSLRHMSKQKLYTFLNICGLALGMTCFSVVSSFVKDEYSYDQYHQDADQLYRLSLQSIVMSSQDENLSAQTPILWGPALKRDYPEVMSFTRFVRLPSEDDPWLFRTTKGEYREQNILHTDPEALQMFNWPLLQGSVEHALSNPRSIVITQSMATKYFGTEDPMGKVIEIDPHLRNNDGILTQEVFEHTVTGVLQDIPHHSHFTFDFLAPADDLGEVLGGDINTGGDLNPWYWRGPIAYTYLKLKEGFSVQSFEAKFPQFLETYLGDATTSRGYYYIPFLQPIEEIYLGGNMDSQLSPVGDRTYPRIFSIVALLILALACINFMNLATARSSIRAREVGIRKTIGAFRRQLILQFLTESVLISFFAFIISIALARLALPVFYSYLGKQWVFHPEIQWPLFTGLLFLSIGVGLLAGSYPAMILSRFKPVEVLRGFMPNTLQSTMIRKGLVVFQFFISAFLILATLTIVRQVNFMKHHELGFDQDHVLVLPPDVMQNFSQNASSLKERLLMIPEVQDVVLTSAVPGQNVNGDVYAEKGADPNTGFPIGEFFVESNFQSLFDLNLLSGRDFFDSEEGDRPIIEENGSVKEVKAILNREAVKKFGWITPENAIGKQIIRDPNAGDWTATVIGVVEDFNIQTLQEPMVPIALIMMPRYSHAAIKLKDGNPRSAIAAIQETVNQFDQSIVFNYNFLDETFQQQYEQQEDLAEVFSYLSILSLVIASLGLFGLASFSISCRVKEIGIRKTLGASTSGLVVLLSQNFLLLVAIAILLSIPVTYFVIEQWLELYAYRIDSHLITFLMGFVILFTIALLTVSSQTLKAAHRNPVISLRAD